MKKRILGLAAVLFLAGSTQLFAWGIGLQGGAGIGASSFGGFAVTFGLDQVPLIFAVDLGFGSGFFGLDATADYWFMNPTIVDWGWGDLKWHWGVGAAVGFSIVHWDEIHVHSDPYRVEVESKTGGSFDIGPRVFIGMNFDFCKNQWDWLERFEAFIQLAYQPMLRLGNIYDFYPFWHGIVNFPLVTGLRLWF